MFTNVSPERAVGLKIAYSGSVGVRVEERLFTTAAAIDGRLYLRLFLNDSHAGAVL